MSENEDLTKGKISSHIKKIAFPVSIALIFQTLYNLVDTFYAGKISSSALAAMTVSFPIYLFILAIGTGVGIGINVLISNAFGSKDKKSVKYISAQAVSFSVVFSILLTIVMYFLTPFIFKLFKISALTLKLSLQYTNIIIIGIIFAVASNILEGILIARGHSKNFRNIIVLGFFINVILDPLFLYGFWIIPPMGMTGIAIATVLIQVITLIYSIVKINKYKLVNFRKLAYFKPNLKKYIEIIKQGFPTTLTTVLFGVGVMIINYFLGFFGDIYIGAYGVVTRLEQLLFLPTIGLNMAVTNIVAQNNGARKFCRIFEAISKSFKYGFIVLISGIILMLMFSKVIMHWFTSDPTIIKVGSYGLWVILFTSFADLILNISAATLQAIKKPRFGMYFSLYKNILLPIIVFAIVYWVFGFGIKGFWWILFIIYWVVAIFSYLIMKYKLKRYIIDIKSKQ